ncbi:MAG: tetratricopeptide repeat protein [Thermoguttaceae bacterium]
MQIRFSNYLFAFALFLLLTSVSFAQAPRSAGSATSRPQPASANAASSAPRPGAAATPTPGVVSERTGPINPVTQPSGPTVADPNSLDNIPEVQEGLELLNKGEREKAAEKFLEAYQKNPNLPPAGAVVAIALYNEKRFDQVRYWLEKTIEDCPTDPETYIILGEVAQAEGRLAEAQLLAAQAIALTKNYESNAERQKKLALRAQLILVGIDEARGKWGDAQQRLEQLIARVPDESDNYMRLGVIYFQLDNLEKSLQQFGKAIEKGAQLPPPYSIVAQLLDQKGDIAKAKQYINEAIKTNQNNFQVMSIAAHLAIKWDMIPQAKMYADAAWKLKPDSAEAKTLCALIALYQKDYPLAQSYYEDILKTDPNNTNAKNGLVLALCEQNDKAKTDLALKIAGENATINPQSLDALTTFAWASYKAGDIDRAEDLLTRIRDSGSISAVGAYYLGEIKQVRGNLDEAKVWLGAALQTPNNFPKKLAAKELLDTISK